MSPTKKALWMAVIGWSLSVLRIFWDIDFPIIKIFGRVHFVLNLGRYSLSCCTFYYIIDIAGIRNGPSFLK